MKSYSSAGIILRAKRAWGIDSDIQFARILGISKSTLSNWKKRDSIDYDILFSKCKHINPSYLINEEGEIFNYGGIDSNNHRSPLIRISILAVLNHDTIVDFENKAKITGGEFLFVNALLHSDENVVQGWVDSAKSVYPDCSIKWLLTGELEINDSIPVMPTQTFKLSTDKSVTTQTVPLYDIEASAGLVAIFNEAKHKPSDYIRIPGIPPVDGAIYARGDSMSPLIASGDIVIFKKVELLPENILWGHIYIVSYSIDGDDYTVLKYIRQSPRSGYLRLESFNSRFDPQDIPASSITALALVKASITFHTIG